MPIRYANLWHVFKDVDCGVIAEKDAEFARVLTPIPVVSSVLPNQRVGQDKLTHRSISQRMQLCQLLDEFADCFVDKPGLCDVITHQIQTTSVRAMLSFSVSCAGCVQGRG